MHWMGDIVVSRGTSGEEAALTNVVVEALETAEPQTYYGILLTNLTLGLMFNTLGRGQTMKRGNPDDALRFLLHPIQKLLRTDRCRIFVLEKSETRLIKEPGNTGKISIDCIPPSS